MGYNERLKPELKDFTNPEESILHRLNQEQQMTFNEIKRLLLTYKEKVTDAEKKDFFSQNKTRDKIFEFGNQLTREKGIITKDNVLFCLLQNVLEGVTLPSRDNLEFDKDGHVAEEIKKAFSVPEK